MSQQQFQDFCAQVAQDLTLQQRLRDVLSPDQVVEIASEAGFDVNLSDLPSLDPGETVELTDQDLEEVTGGTAQIFGCLAMLSLASQNCQFKN
jgi:predicted ribosomally synthesized peptide with nif11-like leader